MGFFTGYLAQGVGGSNAFVENTTSGYSRLLVTLSSLVNGLTGLAGSVSWASGSSVSITQRALYDAPTGGNLIMWWNLVNPVSVTSSVPDPLKAGTLDHSFSALSKAGLGATPAELSAGSQIGTTSTGLPVYSGVALEVSFGTVSAAKFAGASLSGPGGGATSRIVNVTSGTSNTQLLAGVTVCWKSTVNAPKSQTIPGASSANAGQDIVINDSVGTAGSFPITITPASGTIVNAASISITSPNFSLTLRSDGVSNWMVI